MEAIAVELVRGAFTLVAVALGSLIGLGAYFRQKEYELTKQRYLEQGLDVVAGAIQSMLGTVSHNYARALQLCRQYRENGASVDLEELGRGFKEFDASNFHQTGHYRVGSLLNDQIVWNVFQRVMVYASTTNALLTQEIPEAIRKLAAMPEGARDRKADAERMLLDVRAEHEGMFKFAVLGHEIHALCLLLEESRLSRKAVANFHKRNEVRASVQRLRATYPEEEEKHGAAAV